MSTLRRDGLEFSDEETLKRYINLKRRVTIFSTLSLVTMVPALLLFFSSFISSSTSYVYLVFLAVSIPFVVLSYQANSKLTEMLNSDEVRHA
jgi:hypothetical protein